MQKTELYAIGEVRNRGQTSLRWGLVRFLDGVFGCRRTRTRRVRPGDIVHLGPSEGAESLNGRLREMEEARMYTPSRSKPITMVAKEEDRHRLVSPSSERTKIHPNYSRVAATERNDHDARSSLSDASSNSSASSIYSQMTRMPRRAPEPRMPVKRGELDLLRFSGRSIVGDRRRREEMVANPFRK